MLRDYTEVLKEGRFSSFSEIICLWSLECEIGVFAEGAGGWCAS